MDALIYIKLNNRINLSEFINDFVAGIDVSSEFSVVAMLELSDSFSRKPLMIAHNPKSFNTNFLRLSKKRAVKIKCHLLRRIYRYLSFTTLLFPEIECLLLAGLVLSSLNIVFTI